MNTVSNGLFSKEVLTLSQRESPEEAFEQVFGNDLFLEFESRQDAAKLSVLNSQQTISLNALDHREVNEGQHCVASSLDD